jgi:glucose/arabinose dehydrogenase
MPVFTGAQFLYRLKYPSFINNIYMIPGILKNFILLTSLSILSHTVCGQKGMPEKEIAMASVATNYPQHEDFNESMLSRLVVPSGFKVMIAATGLGKPRMMAVGSDGSLYITRRDQGDVLLLKDGNGDGRFDEMKTVHTKFKGVHGITIHNGWIYLCSNRELKRAKIKADGTLETAVLLIKDLPDGGQHGNRTIAFGPDGMLYISVGSTCNDCSETNPENATLLQVKPDGSSRRIFARGLRNTIGFDWHPVTRELWGADNGTDWRGDDIPPEELNKIKDTANYGWPFIYGNRQVDQTREDPPGVTKEEYAQKTEAPVLTFPAHSAPINLVFLAKANGFPADYKDDALISWHGSWNRKEPDGFKVQRILYENGIPVAAEDFLSGFLNKVARTRFGRPAGPAVSEKGMVYVSDDSNGVIYCIIHTQPGK